MHHNFRNIGADLAIRSDSILWLQCADSKTRRRGAPWEHQIAELAYRQVDYEYGRFQKIIKARTRKNLSLLKKLAQFDEFKPAPLPRALLVTDVGPAAPPLFMPKKPQQPIEPGLLTVLNEKPLKSIRRSD